jgi:hypothetical protein
MVMFTPQYQPTTTDSPYYFPFLHPTTLLPILLQSTFPSETQQISQHVYRSKDVRMRLRRTYHFDSSM